MVCPINELKVGYLCSWMQTKSGVKLRTKILDNDNSLSQLYDDVNHYVVEQMGKKANKGMVKVDLHDTVSSKASSAKDSKNVA